MFERKSTGLVRQARWLDTFVFNSSSSWLFGPLVFALSSLTWLQGSDLISAEAIALLFAIAIAAMYAILTATMPRSGGDYVFNSRILHPSIGFAFNFSLTIWQLFAAAFTLFFVANYALSPGLEVLGYYTDNAFLINSGVALGQPANSFVFATLLNILFLFLTSSGLKRSLRALNVLWGITLAGTAVMIFSMLSTNISKFRNSFDGYVRAVNGTGTVVDPYSFFLKQGTEAQLHYALVLPAIAICASSVIWVFWETYVSGEVRRASQTKRNLSSMSGAAILNGILFMVLIYLIYRILSPTLIAGISTLSYYGVVFNSPIEAISAILVLASGNLYAALLVVMAISLGTTVLLLPALYLQPSRSIFAWSIDRIIPTKFGQVSDKWHSPIMSMIASFVVIEAALVTIEGMYQSLLAVFYAVIIAPAFSSIFPTAGRFLSAGLYPNLGAPLPKNARRFLPLLGVISLAFILFMSYVFISNESNFALNTWLTILNFIFIPVGFAIYCASYYIRRTRDKLNLNHIAMEIPPE
ncbi:MAG: amino acid permease [Thaumarchaeota archaeon]|nr:amino acid permease [Nitrososphaerota archaeon]